MDILSKDETKLLLNVAFAAATASQPVPAMKIFDALLLLNPKLQSGRYGKAFVYISCDMFDKGFAILQDLLAEEDCSIKDEIYALLTFSAALQGNSSMADQYAPHVNNKNEAASAMVKTSFEILSA